MTTKFSGAKVSNKKIKTKSQWNYSAFNKIDGSHPYRDQVEGGHIGYDARLKPGGSILYFNFDLAREMGLIPKGHPEKMSKKLERVLLETFGIQIINEYDIESGVEIDKSQIKSKKYMATRYLQLQHPKKDGSTSGDGRSIWNGHFSNGRTTWDISSCGTGATKLSPATAIQGRYFETGDPTISYGCGLADLSDGLSGAILSEIFHNNGIKTERTLALIEYKGGLSINIRAGLNLLRPSHFFMFLKQSNYQSLKSSVDLFIERQASNGDFDKSCCRKNKYDYFLRQMIDSFAEICAKFESEYIFCWLDWDGDNILADGGIIDYGSVRQFGLFHHEYRYDDVERWSTTLTEQKQKTKHICQTFVQLVDYLKTGKKKPWKTFSDNEELKKFDTLYFQYKKQFLLEKIGFKKTHITYLLRYHDKKVERFYKVFRLFEKSKSDEGKIKISDGVTHNAIFCMRDILRSLPHMIATNDLFPETFMDTMRSQYATDADAHLSAHRVQKIEQFTRYYISLLDLISNHFKISESQLLKELGMRASIINRYDRVTGDAIILVSDHLLKKRKKVKVDDFYKLVRKFINYQTLIPTMGRRSEEAASFKRKDLQGIFGAITKIVRNLREGI
ncbi:MAG: hypothetical protein HOE90_12660 [Bacteriovoracaceae bacterium]|jgi:uncharacterized protein YdiU (UPF0061 family)|nr:hypothetical protein [Bacteriovoracaceae bacterium]